MSVRIGISGWRYSSWRGVFYPKGLAQKSELQFASRKLRTRLKDKDDPWANVGRNDPCPCGSGKKYKRIMFFTDMILYSDGAYGRDKNELRRTIAEYRKKVNKDVKVFFFDVAGYANSSPIAKNDENVWTIHGWTEKIFSLIKVLEDGGSIEKAISAKVTLK